ncbi:MAG: ABC transporter permease [Actinomycetota bacterium]|nr:ABC transporter permease [Actinomycetota bacterium]
MTALGARMSRASGIAGAFLWMGYKQEIAYPLSFVMTAVSAVVPAVIFYFVALFADKTGPRVGYDYYTFVVIGLMTMTILSAGLRGFGLELQRAVNQGRFEMLLLEPIRWRFLPLGMASWTVIDRAATSLVILTLSIILGARYDPRGLPAALLILILGFAASFAIGILSGSVMVLAKRSDPVVTLYTLAASVLSGVYFPVDTLPGPLQALSWVIPHTYVLNALRKGLMPQGGGMPGLSINETLLALLAFNVVIFPLVLWIFGRSLEVGRRLGVLSGY